MSKSMILLTAFFFFFLAAPVGMYVSEKIHEQQEKSAVMQPQSNIWGGKKSQSPEYEILADDFQEGPSCDVINWGKDGKGDEDHAPVNTYLLLAQKDEGRYDPDEAVKEFLSNMDTAFQDRMELFEEDSFGCDLVKIDTPSALQDQKIDDYLTFSRQQWEEFHKIGCALQEMITTGTLQCTRPFPVMRGSQDSCEKEFRHNAQEILNNLSLSLEIALTQVSEATNVWPLHKRIECLNEKITDQRELFIEFLDIYSKYPAAFINAAQSQ